MQDESLIDEMRKTLREDRERAVDRKRWLPAQDPQVGLEPGPEIARPRRGLLSRFVRLQRRT